MVDPNAPQGLPPGVPPGPGGPPPGMAGPGGPPPGAPPAPNPTTDPNQLASIIAAIMQQGAQEFEGQQQQALGQAVTQLLQQAPNTAGLAATTMPGGPPAPPMPSGPGGTGGAMDDPSLGPAGA